MLHQCDWFRQRVLIMLLLSGPLSYVISSTSGSRTAATRWALWISLTRLVKAPRHPEQLQMHRSGSTKTCCESGPVHRQVFPRRLSELQMSGWNCESTLRSKREEDEVRRRLLGNPSPSLSVLLRVMFFLCVCVCCFTITVGWLNFKGGESGEYPSRKFLGNRSKICPFHE